MPRSSVWEHEASGRLETGLVHSPERLHFWGLLTALASKPVYVLGSSSHHLVGLQLALVLRTIHLGGEANKGVTWERVLQPEGLAASNAESVP